MYLLNEVKLVTSVIIMTSGIVVSLSKCSTSLVFAIMKIYNFCKLP